jgi:hypothetical protein
VKPFQPHWFARDDHPEQQCEPCSPSPLIPSTWALLTSRRGVAASRIIAVLESADRDPSLIAKGALNFVIVGAGPTGAEMSGTLGDMTQCIVKDVYKDLDLSKAQLVTRMDISARASIDVSQ